jgi:hypothetical protein
MSGINLEFKINGKVVKIEIEDEYPRKEETIDKPNNDTGGIRELVEMKKEDGRGKSIGELHKRVKMYLLEHENIGYREAMKLIGQQMKEEHN